jgi:hypothetical protein
MAAAQRSAAARERHDDGGEHGGRGDNNAYSAAADQHAADGNIRAVRRWSGRQPPMSLCVYDSL